MNDMIRENIVHFANLNDVDSPVFISHLCFFLNISTLIRWNTGFCRPYYEKNVVIKHRLLLKIWEKKILFEQRIRVWFINLKTIAVFTNYQHIITYHSIVYIVYSTWSYCLSNVISNLYFIHYWKHFSIVKLMFQ